MNGQIPVTRSSMPPLDEYVAEIAPLWDSRWLTNMGEKHHVFQQSLERYLEVEHVCLFTNGHLALEGIFEAMGIGSDGRNEVITTPFTFASTTHAIVRKGLTPVMADIKPGDCTIDPESVESLVNDHTCAIVPVHVYGNICDDDALRAIAMRHNLKVIYDGAHAFGVKRDGAPVATLGNATMFSFHATKVFNTVEGGAVAFNGHPSFEPRLNQWKNFGIMGPEDVEYIGGNAKMSEFQAAMGICNLRHVEDEIKRRRKVDERYRERFDGISGVRIVSGGQLGVNHNCAYMAVVFNPSVFGASRDDVFMTLDSHGILARKYFYPATNEFACYEGVLDPAATPVAHVIAKEVLCLPMYADLAIRDVDRICDIVLESRRG